MMGRMVNASQVGWGGLTNHFAGDAHDDAAGRDLLAFGDERAGGDEAAGADDRTVEHDRTDADQAVVFDGSPMHDSPVSEAAPTTDAAGEVGVGVEDAPILDVTSLADNNFLGIPSNHGGRQDDTVFTQTHATYYDGGWGDPGGLRRTDRGKLPRRA